MHVTTGTRRSVDVTGASREARRGPAGPEGPKHGRALVAGPVWLHHPRMEIRDAQPEDAHSACEVVRRSISELCAADHGNDPTVLSQWLKNKTLGNVASWIARPDNSVLVAVEHGTILAVGAVTDSGEVTLNYVSPGARFRGVSRALLSALENRAAEPTRR